MKILSIAYDNSTSFIVDIANEFKDRCIVYLYNNNVRAERKSVNSIQNKLGTSNLPAALFEDENLEIIGGVWPENSPNWKQDILDKLNELTN